MYDLGELLPSPLARFYDDYIAACREFGIAPLPPQQVIVLVEMITARVAVTLH